MADLTADFEAGVAAADITTGAGEASATAWDSVLKAATGTVVYDDAHAYDGLSAKCANVTAAHHAFCRWGTAFGTQTDHFGRLYCYFTANPAATLGIAKGHQVATQAWIVCILADGKIQLRDGINTSSAGAVAISLNQWVRIEYHIVHSTTVGVIEAKLFNNADASTASETITTPANRNTRSDSTLVSFGIQDTPSAAANSAFWIDNVLAGATSYPGPVPVSGGESGDSVAGATVLNYYWG